jgi:hypothetical protein
MIRILTVALIGIFATGCATWGKEDSTARAESDLDLTVATTVQTMEEVDQNIGQTVRIDGTLTELLDEHGVLTTDADMRVLIPNFAMHALGKPWGNYINKRFVVIGTLWGPARPHMDQLANWQGPSIDAKVFQVGE